MRKENLEKVFDAILDILSFHNLYQEHDEDGSYWVSKSIEVSGSNIPEGKDKLLNIELFTNNITILIFNRKGIDDRIKLYGFKKLGMVLNIIHGLRKKECRYCTVRLDERGN